MKVCANVFMLILKPPLYYFVFQWSDCITHYIKEVLRCKAVSFPEPPDYLGVFLLQKETTAILQAVVFIGDALARNLRNKLIFSTTFI